MGMQNSSLEIKGSLFQFISSLLKKHKVRGVLVGGYALNANKVQRMTFDIDFMVTADDCSKIEPDLIKAGYSVFNRQDAFVQFKGEKHGLRDLDFLIGDRQTLEIIINQGKQVVIAGETFTVPSVFHLIAMKLHSMTNEKRREIKDLPDVVQLMKENAIDPLDNSVREIFRKYEGTDLYKRIVEAVGTANGK